MKIRSATASFGGLNSKTLIPGSGLNVVLAPNGSGKSTWCGFLVSMLTGPDGDTASKYTPPGGITASGILEYEHNGRNIILTRDSTPGNFFDVSEIAEEGGTSGSAGDITPEQITGVSRDVFTRSFFIGSLGVRGEEYDPDGELLVLQSVGGAGLIDRYCTLKNRAESIENMELPALREKTAHARQESATASELAGELKRLRAERSALENTEKKLRSDLELFRRMEAVERSSKIADARERALEAGKIVDDLRALLTKNGIVVTQEDITGIVSLYSEYSRALDEAAEGGKKASAAMGRVNILRKKRDESVFAGMSSGEAMEIADRARDSLRVRDILERKNKSVRNRLLKPAAFAFPMVGMIFAAQKNFNGTAVCLLLLLLCCVIRTVRKTRLKKASGAQVSGITGFTVDDADELRELADGYSGLLIEIEAAGRDSIREEKNAERLRESAESTKNRLMDFVHVFFPEITDPSKVGPEVDLLSGPLKALPRAELELARALAETSALISSSAPVEDVPYEAPPTEQRPSAGREETQAELESAAKRVAEIDAACASLQSRLDGYGGTLAAAARTARLSSEADELERELHTCRAAADDIERKMKELTQTYLLPVLRLTGEIFSGFTVSQYDRASFAAMLSAAENSGSVRLGTRLPESSAKLLDLSFKLAVAQLLQPEQGCPLIVDDIFGDFDDDRDRRVMEYLVQLSHRRQIIVFTCRGREVDFALKADGERTTVIKLQDD